MESNTSIIIDEFKFILLGKKLIDKNLFLWHVFISSENIHTKETINFWAYPSTSELGLWRLLANIEENFNYKGHHVPASIREDRAPGDYFYYDYVQQTFIHIDLQIFINQNIDDLKILKYPKDALVPHKPYKPERKLSIEYNEKIFEVIDDRARQIHLSPFILL